jgi:hypothetical protein
LANNSLYGQRIGTVAGTWIQVLKSFIFVKYGLYEETNLKLGSEDFPLVPGLSMVRKDAGVAPQDGVVVGTVRMGYGHHRMAYALYTWAIAKGEQAHLHDLLAFDCKESIAIKDIDGLYSQMSRVSSEMGGLVEWVWGQITAAGNITSLELSLQLAERYKNLMNNIPASLPYLSTYPLNGQVAAAAGTRRVVHLIPDNYPQYYLLVPGAINLVQSPASYMKFLEMGVPRDSLAVAGHWVSHKLSSQAISMSEQRMARSEKKLRKRYLMPIGGAGAQKSYLFGMLKSLKDKLNKKKLELWVNIGDHQGLFSELKEFLEQNQITSQIIEGHTAMKSFCDARRLDHYEDVDNPGLVIFHFPNHFEAFSATDILMEVTDVLVTKPSELAFFPIPKIFIRRVGDHEAASAFRSMELGEGTMECREVEHAVEMIRLFTDNDGIFVRMNECIIRNSREGIYDGARVAVEIARS